MVFCNALLPHPWAFVLEAQSLVFEQRSLPLNAQALAHCERKDDVFRLAQRASHDVESGEGMGDVLRQFPAGKRCVALSSRCQPNVPYDATLEPRGPNARRFGWLRILGPTQSTKDVAAQGQGYS